MELEYYAVYEVALSFSKLGFERDTMLAALGHFFSVDFLDVRTNFFYSKSI